MKKKAVPHFTVRKPSRFSKHPESKYAIRGRIWVEKDGELYLGWGRVILLENIEKFGSIAVAARSMKLGYRNAWLWVDAMNRLAPAPVVHKGVGGAGGGHATLTEEGKKIVARYKELRSTFQGFLQQAKQIFSEQ